ncbi:MAG: type II secretion system protein [Sarcina sp.]
MQRNLNKEKKKGFTLIELVIVLSVLAIIALIAVPNFTKVRNDSLIKADERSAEQIEKITLLAIADNKIAINTEYFINTESEEIKITTTDVASKELRDSKTKTDDELGDYKELLKDVKAPQVPGTTGFIVSVSEVGEVGVKYRGDAQLGDSNKILAGKIKENTKSS